MRINYIRLVGYIGIYNGLGLNEITIDFTKCKYKKIIIKGANGCGKSTLIRTLHIMPDSNSVLIPNMECRKEVTLINNDIIYNIQIIHPISSKFERTQTRAYIQKSSPEGMIELNPNGNIRSYKEIVFSELNLDPNFIALSQLSGENKGLASLRPAERKKFVNSIIGNISSYNDLNKTFTKRSNEFRAMRNSIISKINNLGNIDKLTLALNNIELRWNQLNKEKEDILQAISSERTKIQMLDKNNEIQNRFNEISSQVKIINSNLNDLNNKLITSSKNFEVEINKDLLNKFYEEVLIVNKNQYEMEIKINESKIESLLIERENDAKRLQELSGKLKALENNNLSKTKLINLIKECDMNLDRYSKMIANMKIKNINDISKDEFILALNTLHDIKDMVLYIKDMYTYDTINEAIAYIKGDLTYDIVYHNYDTDIDMYESILDKTKTDIMRYTNLVEKVNILKDRPKDCKIDSCPLIKESLEAVKLNPEKELEALNNKYEEYLELKQESITLKYRYGLVNRCYNDLSNLIRNIDRNANIIRKLIVDERFLNSDRIIEIISDNNIFREIETIYNYIDMANIIDSYKIELEKRKEYNNQLNIIKQKETITDDIVEQVKYAQEKFNTINNEIEICNKNIINNKNELSNTKSAILDVQYILELFNNIESNQTNKQKLLNEFEEIKNSMKTIKISIDNIDIMTNKLNNINKELVPLTNEKEKLQHSIKLLNEYQIELKEYNEKYEIIETLKKYSSPTSGIQTIFINLYMNKTLSLANQLLQLMFNGKYALCQFIINENEFKIPCMGSGLINDDISSMSTSETCMISMILSFAILQQASTDYNILILDEIDGGLDTYNRLTFLEVLESLINILNVEQCFIISHNDEINLNDCDIILLKTNGQYTNIEGNIIFKY